MHPHELPSRRRVVIVVSCILAAVATTLAIAIAVQPPSRDGGSLPLALAEKYQRSSNSKPPFLTLECETATGACRLIGNTGVTENYLPPEGALPGQVGRYRGKVSDWQDDIGGLIITLTDTVSGKRWRLDGREWQPQ